MSIRTILCAGAIVIMTTPAFAADIIVETAPPAVQTETMPAARTGYIWSPGYQRWRDDHYEWVSGHWVEAKLHSHWVGESWEKVDDTHWRFREGHWSDD